MYVAGGILAFHYGQNGMTQLQQLQASPSSLPPTSTPSSSGLLEFHILHKWVHGSSDSQNNALRSLGTLAVQAWTGLLTCRQVQKFRPASARSAALGTPLYLYYSLLFSYSFHSFHSSEREERKEYIREYIRGGYRGVARAGLKDSCDIFLTWVEMVCTCMIEVYEVL